MIEIGRFNTLKVIKEASFGLYLDGKEWGDILLPNKVVPKGTSIGSMLDVFIYFDSEDKIIATTVCPKALVGNCAFLKVIHVTPVGAFLDWGLDKDLLVPMAEQKIPMEMGKSYLVYIKIDHKHRPFASSKLDYFLDKTPATYSSGDEVSLFIANKTDLGNKVVINSRHWGLIHSADIFKELRFGQNMTGYIKTIRTDGKIDVVLRKQGQENTADLGKRILIAIEKAGGFLPLGDKSDPKDIQKYFGESKKSFKNAIGGLYKKGLISIEDNEIRLIGPVE